MCCFKLAAAFGLSLILAGCMSGRVHVPTPAMALQVGTATKRDQREWRMQNLQGNERQILAELVPAGDSIKDWKEMQAHQILFTKQPLREHVDQWKATLARSANSTQKETVLPDGAIMVEYEAPEADEIGIRKFMSGPDGIYAFAYHVRKAHRTDDKYNLWREIVAETKLFPNPERRR